jgi:hypothetical protein
MGRPILQLGNAQNWQAFFNGSYSAQIINGGRDFVPLGSVTLPVLSDRRILVAGTTSTAASPNWRTGGWLTPILQCGGAPFQQADLRSERIPLESTRILILPDLTEGYRLRFSIPRWLKQVDLEIWQYIGPEKDSTEELIRQLQTQIGSGSSYPPSVDGGFSVPEGTTLDGGFTP